MATSTSALDRGPEPIDVESRMPVVLIIGGFLTSPPQYTAMRRRLLRRGAQAVGIAPIWLPDWLLATRRGLGAIAAQASRAVTSALDAADPGARLDRPPLVVVGHSAGGLIARLLTSPVPFDGRTLDRADRIGAIVTLGTPHRVAADRGFGRSRILAATSFANGVVPGPTFMPTTGYLAVASRAIAGRVGGSPRERAAARLYSEFPLVPAGPSRREDRLGDGLVPSDASVLDGADTVVLDDIVHGQLAGRPWYGSDEAVDRWWPRAVDVWRSAVLARRR